MKKICAIILSVCIISNYMMVDMYSYEEKNELTYAEWIGSDGDYEFPISQYDDEWYKLDSVIEMREVTQLPDDLLEDISTDDLIQLILKYPLLCDLNAFATIQEGYIHLKGQFNAIDELLSREDAYKKLLLAYSEYVVPNSTLVDYTEIINADDYVSNINNLCKEKESRNKLYRDANVIDAMNMLECLIMDIVEIKEISIEEFLTAYMNKANHKNKSEYYAGRNVYSLLTDNYTSIDRINEENQGLYVTNSSSTITIHTPSGYSVSVRYTEDLTMCNASEYMGLIAEYNASLMTSASTTFNCHSFAWLYELRSDYQHIWMDNVSTFCSDPYYRMTTSPMSYSIAYYNFGAHSAIVLGVSDDPNDTINYPEAYCVSKWGAGPLVYHFVKRCPYYTSASTMRYYSVAD